MMQSGPTIVSTGTFQHVAFDIIVAVRDHRAVQAEQHTVER
jgi:hypothetical protein